MDSTCGNWLLLTCMLAIAFVAGCDSSGNSANSESDLQAAREKGIREAKAAIADGKLKLKEYPPLPSPPGRNEYTALLRERCGVESEVISTPDFSRALQQEVSAWNDTMRAEIRRRFGDDIFQQLQDEAKQNWQGKLPRQGKE